MLRRISRNLGLALVLGVLALTPLTALADHIPGYTADPMDGSHGTVLIPPDRNNTYTGPSFHDEGEPALGSSEAPKARYEGDVVAAIESIAAAGHLTWNMATIRYLEANIWDYGYEQAVIVQSDFVPPVLAPNK